MNLSAVKKKRYRNRKAPYLFADMWSPCRDSKTIKKTPTLPMCVCAYMTTKYNMTEKSKTLVVTGTFFTVSELFS